LGETIPSVSKCQPADTLFYRAINGAFDVVVALYHDQGLAPLKAVEFETAVNVTLGLPYVRTSPDHGTGYEIAGTGEASPKSFSRAIELAIQLVGRNRET
jgi:4-hydroxythreonine-4-phosphate dehydrogenase